MSKTKISVSQYRMDGSKKLSLDKIPNLIAPLYEGKKEYRNILEDYQESINELQTMMYAHDHYSLLLIFQAMDAAGKDGTIRHVMSGVNPHGVIIHAFKRPSSTELDHDYMWRTTTKLPMRGKIGIFNRSYYEEVLVVRVHEKILTEYQKVPDEFIQDIPAVWDQRLEDIRNFEKFLHRNGTRVVKFFLNLSKEEQKNRFLARLNTPSKNWKFEEGDLKERQYWDDYQSCYEDAINATATDDSPWYVIPADDKKNMRLMVAQAIEDEMSKLDISYPSVNEERKAEFDKFREMLNNE